VVAERLLAEDVRCRFQLSVILHTPLAEGTESSETETEFSAFPMWQQLRVGGSP